MKKNLGNQHKQEGTVIQSLILSKEEYESREEARSWIVENGYRADKIDETEVSYRFRQREPSEFIEGSFRTIDITDGVKAVIGRIKEDSRSMNSENMKKLLHTKEIDTEKRQVTGYVSTYQWDRDGERFVKGAWNLDSYRKNPVVLWAHDHLSPPIGRNIDLIEDDIGLKAVTEFDREGDVSRQIFSLFERGFLNSFSVGFRRNDFVLEEMGNGEKGLAITNAELFEYSAVSIPANPGALVARDVAEIAMKTIPHSIEVIQTKSLGDQYLVLPSCGDPKLKDAKKKNPEDEFVPCLKQVIELARIAKGTPLSETKMSLMSTAMNVFNEMMGSHKEEVSHEELIKLKGILVEFAGLVAAITPDAAEGINKTIFQIEKAVTGRA